MEDNNHVYCPLYKRIIEVINCFDIVMVCTDGAPDHTIPKEIREINDFKLNSSFSTIKIFLFSPVLLRFIMPSSSNLMSESSLANANTIFSNVSAFPILAHFIR